MTPMVQTVLSSFLHTLVEWILPLVLAELRNVDLDLDHELLRPLSSINGMVEEVERRVEVSSAHKTWLDHVQDAVYETNDLVDEIATELLRRRQIEFFPDMRKNLSKFSIRRGMLAHNVASSLRNVKKDLEEIVKESGTVLLSSGGSSPRRRENLQTNRFLQGPVFGRSDDVKFILGWISDKCSPANFDVLSIQGMAGVGKTTLAKMVFNDESVANQFRMKKWVHTPQGTDVTTLFKSMMESFTGNGCQLFDLNILQEQLRNLLDKEKYLLVLDEMSIESDEYWQNLKTILSVGAVGSKVLITTCKRKVADLAKALPYQLDPLSEDDSSMLINTSTDAFKGPNPEADPSLNETRRRILEKCKGLPSALVAFGRSIERHQNGIDRWNRTTINETEEIIGLDNEIFRTMSSTMKRCFAYCSAFPPGFQFKKETLVQLWMAQNFAQTEDECGDFFDNMFNCFLFQYLDYDFRKKQQTYVMHDCIRGTAQLMAGGEYCMVDQGNTRINIRDRTRHVSVVGNPNNTMGVDFNSVYVAKGLYSLLIISHQNMNKVNLRVVPDDLATKLPRLRSLDLSNTHIQELPDSIGNLKHLRYLALQNTRIKKLPHSIGELYNLQTLGLANCYELAKFPSSLKSLLNLMYLDLQLDDDSKPRDLKRMPPHMSKLEGLITLSRFVSSSKDYCGVSELGTLTKLRDNLCISNLHSIVDIREAQVANLGNKDHLRVLELQWGLQWRNITGARLETNVLEYLRPHNNLEELRIKGYAGYSFPDWMTTPSFSFLATLKLIDCKACNHLPPLGHLPALQRLFIKGMDGIVTIDCSLCGRGGNRTSFQSLREMHLESMPNLQAWIGDDHPCNFPSLCELTIRDCNNLTQISHSFPSLEKLEIIRCRELHGLRRFPSLSSLDVRESGQWIWASLRCLPSLSSMTLAHLPMMAPLVAMQPLTTIRRLEIIGCGTPEYLPDNWLPSKLTHLLIKYCPNLRALPGGLHEVETLQELKVQDCENLESGGRIPPGLQSLSVDRCPNFSRWIKHYGRRVVQAPTVLIYGAPLWSSTQSYSEGSTSNF